MADALDPGVDLVAATVARLTATGSPVRIAELKSAAGAADLARLVAAKSLPAAHSMPAAFVIEPGDTAGANSIAAGMLVRQLVTVRLVIVLALYRPNDPTGSAALEQLELLKPKLMAALVGWQPGPDLDPIEHERRRLLSGVGSPLVVYEQAVRTAWQIRKH